MSNDAVLKRAKDRFDRGTRRTRYARTVAEECRRFVAGEQWEKGDITARETTGRPIVTVNKMQTFVNMVVNKHAMDKTRIKVVANENTDDKTAAVVNGLIRHIQYSEKSDAGDAYDQAFYDLVTSGYGAIAIETEYCSWDSFDQEIIISKIDDPDSVYLDENGDFATRLLCVNKEDYPDKTSFDTELVDKEDDDEITLLEYWERTKEKVTIYKINVVPAPVQDQLPQDTEQAVEQVFGIKKPLAPGMHTVTELPGDDTVYTIIKQRQSEKPIVKKYLMDANSIISVDDWPGQYIPIVVLKAREHEISEGCFYKPLIYDGIGPQRLYNFNSSQQAELLQKAPRSVWVGVEGVFSGHEDEFSDTNLSSRPYLEHAATDVDGNPAPAPSLVSAPAPSSGFFQETVKADDEIKSTIGLFNPSLGNTGNETSGRAILARQQQGDIGTYHFTKVGISAMRRLGIILIDLIPHYYDSERSIKILGEDMADEVVWINKLYRDEKTGENVLYDMRVGTYDVKVDTGAPTTTRKMDAAENLMKFAEVIPAAAQVSGHLIARNMDFDGAEELSNLMKATVPPDVFARVEEMKAGNGSAGNPAAMQARQMQGMQQQMQGMQQQMAQMAQENAKLRQDLSDNEMIIEQMKIDGRIREEQIRAESNIRIAQIKTNNAQGIDRVVYPPSAINNQPRANVPYDGRTQGVFNG